MKTIKELYAYLNKRIPSSLSCDWDNDGLMCCPNGEKPAERVLVALDITERIVDYAVKNKFDVIISHHPLIFKKIGALNDDLCTSRKAIKLIQNGISAMSFHTRLDAVSGGVNDILANRLGLIAPIPFGPSGEEMGRVGTLSAPMELSDFCKKIKSVLGSTAVLAADAGKTVSKVAILGGDGKDFISEAMKTGADTYVSGRIGYNVMAEGAENGMNLIEAGHFFTEDIVCPHLEALVKELCPEIITEHICSNEIKLF